MIPGLGGILERVTGLFGKTYVVAGFIPVLILAGVSLLAGYDSTPWVRRQVDGYAALGTAEQALAAGALLVAVAALGMVFWSASAFWLALLKGAAMPRPLYLGLRNEQQRRAEELDAGMDLAELLAFEFRTRVPRAGVQADPATAWKARLLAARMRGNEKAHPWSGDATHLRKELAALRQATRSTAPPGVEAFDAFCGRLAAELEAGRIDKGCPLDDLQVKFADVAEAARARVENDYARAMSDLRGAFPTELAVLGPTRLANVAELSRDYALNRYEMDPEVFWLHLQRAAAADDQFRPLLEDARLRLDVSVALTVACLVSGLWVWPVALFGHSLPILVLTGAVLPLAALLFYRSTQANLRVYGAAVRATVDLFRFDVLKALHLPFPATLEHERALWRRLTLSHQSMDVGDFVYADV